MAKPSAAVLAARGRRNPGKSDVEIKWFIKNVSDKVALSLQKRTRIVTEVLKSRVVSNISRPVTVSRGPRGGRVVTNRSDKGEFPKAETTQLMKTIFGEIRQVAPGVWEGYVGTPLDYGLILETRRNRSFLVRTLNEQRPVVKKILSGPVR